MNDRPVSSQLQRIEDGLDTLLQSHAALEKQLEAIDVVGDANRFESAERYKEITGLLTREFGALAGRLGAIEQRLEGIKAELCPVCAALPADINPTEERLAMRICDRLRKGEQTDNDVDWTEKQVSKFLNYAMRKLPKPGKSQHKGKAKR